VHQSAEAKHAVNLDPSDTLEEIQLASGDPVLVPVYDVYIRISGKVFPCTAIELPQLLLGTDILAECRLIIDRVRVIEIGVADFDDRPVSSVAMVRDLKKSIPIVGSKRVKIFNETEKSMYVIIKADPNERQVSKVGVGANAGVTGGGANVNFDTEHRVSPFQTGPVHAGKDPSVFVLETSISYLTAVAIDSVQGQKKKIYLCSDIVIGHEDIHFTKEDVEIAFALADELSNLISPSPIPKEKDKKSNDN